MSRERQKKLRLNKALGSKTGRRELIYGESGSGKTFLLFKRLTNEFFSAGKYGLHPKRGLTRKYYFIMVQPSYQFNSAYEEFPYIKQLFQGRYGEHHLDWTEELSLAIKKIMKKNANKPKNKIKQIVLVLDDLGQNTWMKSGGSDTNIIQFMSSQAAHYPIRIISLFQRPTDASPSFRNNADIVTFFDSNVKNVLDYYHQDFFGRLSKKNFIAKWNDIFDEPYNSLTILKGSGGHRSYELNDEPFNLNT